MWVANTRVSCCIHFHNSTLKWVRPPFPVTSFRFYPTRSGGPTLTAMGRWMKTSPAVSRTITVSAASTTAFTSMSPFFIFQGVPCSCSLFFSISHILLVLCQSTECLTLERSAHCISGTNCLLKQNITCQVSFFYSSQNQQLQSLSEFCILYRVRNPLSVVSWYWWGKKNLYCYWAHAPTQ